MRMVDGRPFVCTKCGKCCKWEGEVYLTDRDIDRLSDALDMSVEVYSKKYTTTKNGRLILKDKDGVAECIHMDGNKCGVYEHRPYQCRNYPIEYDSRCPGFGKVKESAMKSKYQEIVERMNEKFSGSQDFLKSVSDNLYNNLKKNVKTATVVSEAMSNGVDYFLDDSRIKVASLDDLFAFHRVDKNNLIHKSNRDLWAIEADDNGDVHIARLFDNNGDPIKG